ncbi:MAG TPA: methyltransferase domain-containing protein [Vitreimonas sp.]|nr:methyltransferase domain-containing protein [Vitreimonas sp.]
MSTADQGQVTATAATVYEEFFVPALLAQWTEPMIDAAGIRAGHRVLDVACGTGVLARAVAATVGPQGRVVGLDLNDGMLDVARRKEPQIEWLLGRAEDLPFRDGEFDAAVSQFGLMFFEDRTRAVAEMVRVVRGRGRAAIAVWGRLDRSPGYLDLTALLDRLFGRGARDALAAPFVLGDEEALRTILTDAGLTAVEVTARDGVARFPSLESWMETEIRGWTLADALDDAAFDRLVVEAQRDLHRHVQHDGSVVFPIQALVARGSVAG